MEWSERGCGIFAMTDPLLLVILTHISRSSEQHVALKIASISYLAYAVLTIILSSRNLGRQAPPRPGQPLPPSRGNSGSPAPYSPSSLAPPNIGLAPASPSLSAATIHDPSQQNPPANKVPLFFRDEYATFMVRGNFMTLAAKPILVEEGEWLAHQRKLQNLLHITRFC
jgi:hypothetical protein